MPGKNQNFIEKEALFLICVMTEPRDLEIARVLGWYRIPFRTAPKVINVDYLAFYQTMGFGHENGGKINFYAEVRGHELVPRHELFRDEVTHPRAKEEYYKIQLGPLIPLEKPLTSKSWKRITFFYSTGELFNNALQVEDLVVRTEERNALWHSLRERASNNGNFPFDEQSFIDLDPSILSSLGYWLTPNENSQ